MALPPGVLTRALAFGRYHSADGYDDYVGMVGRITPSTAMLHVESGDVITDKPINFVIGPDGSVVVPGLVCSDSPGLFSLSNKPLTYTVEWPGLGLFAKHPPTKTFPLLSDEPGDTTDYETIMFVPEEQMALPFPSSVYEVKVSREDAEPGQPVVLSEDGTTLVFGQFSVDEPVEVDVPVTSVAGRIGDIVLTAADISGTFNDNQIPGSIARDTEVTTRVNDAVVGFVRASDVSAQVDSAIDGLATVATTGSYSDLGNKPVIPTTPGQVGAQPSGDYPTAAQVADTIATRVPYAAVGQNSGVASLDNTGKIPQAQLPAVALQDFLGVVGSQAAMLALVGQRGDWCTRSDKGTDWSLVAEPSSSVASWRERTYPQSPVTSVAGRVGAVTLSVSDIADSTTVGQNVVKAVDAAAARAAIGAGTSSFSGSYVDLSAKPAIPTTPADIGAQAAGDYATNTALTNAVATRVPTSSVGVSLGVASLDNAGKIPQAQLPAIALTEFLGAVSTQTAMLGLVGQRGDWCTRTDRGTDYQLIAEPSSSLASWRERTYPQSPVTSVAGRVGAVVLSADDVSDATAVGKSLVRAADASAARLAIGAADASSIRAVDVQIFTVDGTWTKPAGAKVVEVKAIGGGGGGGGGGLGLQSAAAVTTGGSGGGGAAAARAVITAATLPGTVAVTVGLGGFGGPARSGTAALTAGAGAQPGSGGNSSFGTFLSAPGGSRGNTGTTTTSAIGAGGIGQEAGGNGGASNNSTGGLTPTSTPAGASGGGGGGIIAGNAVRGLGGAAGAHLTYISATAGVGGAVGSPGTAGSDQPFVAAGVGGGGGGALQNGSTIGLPGGAGGKYGGGGGGGGAAWTDGTTPVTTGAGGNGGDGAVVVYTYF